MSDQPTSAKRTFLHTGGSAAYTADIGAAIPIPHTVAINKRFICLLLKVTSFFMVAGSMVEAARRDPGGVADRTDRAGRVNAPAAAVRNSVRDRTARDTPC